jgi:malate dehydrogenase (oxaloacetate-decarboxylating)(NADP+)
VVVGGRRLLPSQTNNAYIFPGLGLAVVAAGARRVTETMLLAAARALAEQADDGLLGEGALFPPLQRIREVSLKIAVAVTRVVEKEGLAERELPENLEAYLRGCMYQPVYPEYFPESS